MCAKREEEVATEDHHQNNIQRFQEEELNLQQQNMGINDYSYSSSNTTRLMFPSPSSSSSEISPIMHHQQQPSSWSSLPQVLHHQNSSSSYFQYPTRDHDPFLFPPPQHPQTHQLSCYGGGLFNRSRVAGGGLQLAYDHGSSSYSDLRLQLSETTLAVAGQSPGPGLFGLQTEMGKMTAQEIMDAKALAASKSHSEAERRRRERINNHLAKLRSLLPSTTKTDKASLLAEVIQHVKELKRQTSIIAEQSPVPTEIDELSVDKVVCDDKLSDDHGKLVIRASLCCEDRPDLLPDLIKTLKALRLRTLKAEITTLGGRVKNVLFITKEEEEEEEDHYHILMNGNGNADNNINHQQQQQMVIISTIQEALKQVMEKSSNADHHHDSSSAGCSVKRQRTTNNICILP